MIYTIVFYATPLKDVSAILGHPFARFQVFPYLLIPDEIFGSWLGNNGRWAILDRVAPISLAVVIILTSWVGGVAILQLLGIADRCDRGERLVLAVTVGLNLLSTGVLLLGLFGLVATAMPVFCLLVGAWLLFLAVEVRKRNQMSADEGNAKCVREHIAPSWLRSLLNPIFLKTATPRDGKATVTRKATPASEVASGRSSVSQSQTNKRAGSTSDLFGLAWLIWVGTLGVLILLQGVLPPTDFDVREYHLQAPKEFHLAGGIGFIPHNVYANMPLGTEMHALAAMTLSGDVRTGALAGKTVTAFYGLILMAAVYAAAQRWARRSHAVAACLALAATPWLVNVSTAGLNDIALAVYVFTAFYAFTRAWESQIDQKNSNRAGKPNGSQSDSPRSPDLGWLSLAGYLAGAAAACKYTGLVYTVIPLAALMMARVTRHANRQAAKATLVFALAVGFGGGAWYAKNAVLCGNPTYPLLYRWFGGYTWDDQKNERWGQVHAAPDYAPASLAKDAFRLAVASDWLGPLVWPFAIVSLVSGGRLDSRRRVLWLMAAWIPIVWWLLTHRIDRFWLPLLPFLAVGATEGMHAFSQYRVWRWSVYAVVIPALVVTLLLSSAGICSYNRILAPLSDLWDDPDRIGEAHVTLNRMWPNVFSGKLLTVGDAAVFDFEMPVVYATCFDDQPWEVLTKGKSPKEIHEILRREGIGCVFVNWAEIARYRSPGNYGFTDYVEPKQFHDLVRAGVLQPVLMPDRSPGQAYLVKIKPQIE